MVETLKVVLPAFSLQVSPVVRSGARRKQAMADMTMVLTLVGLTLVCLIVACVVVNVTALMALFLFI